MDRRIESEDAFMSLGDQRIVREGLFHVQG
jgi:hypothetical protein